MATPLEPSPRSRRPLPLWRESTTPSSGLEPCSRWECSDDRLNRRPTARGAIGEALAIFERLGARLWADKARTELGRISGRPPAPSELTGTEHQVATLAAEGRSNKEIAADMHLGVSTVEAHLSSVYRKLGVKRAELGARLRKDTAGG